MASARDYWEEHKPSNAYSDGYHYPAQIVYLGHGIWKRSGIIPDPRELMRLDRRWLSDLFTRDDLIMMAKPEHD